MRHIISDMRNIEKIIIHCSATPEGRVVTVQDIDRWHRQAGYSCIGYHYVIGLDGSVVTGRAHERIGAHTKGQNSTSIGICYIGGCDKNMKPKDTRTAAQKASMVNLIRSLLVRYPSATVHGHREFAQKDCPCFDVQQWKKEVGL